MCDSTLPYTLTSPGSSQRLVLLIPHDCLDDDIDLEEFTSRSFSGTAGVGRLVFGIAGWLVEELASINSERADVLAQNHHPDHQPGHPREDGTAQPGACPRHTR